MKSVLFSITVTSANEKGPIYTEQALSALHAANRKRLPVSLIFACHNQKTGLFCRCPPELSHTIRKHFLARYEDAEFQELRNDALQPQSALQAFLQELCLRPDVFPILRHPQFQDAMSRAAADPVSGLLAAVTPEGPADIPAVIEIVIRPARRRRVRHAQRIVRWLDASFFRASRLRTDLFALCATSHWRLLRFAAALLGRLVYVSPAWSPLHISPGRDRDREDDLQGAQDKVARHRSLFETHIRLLAYAPKGSRSQARAKIRELAAAFAQFQRLARFRPVRFLRCRGSLLSDEELATLFHPPIDTVQTPAMARTEFRRLEPPVNLPLKDRDPLGVTSVGRITYQARGDVFGLRLEDRMRHLVITGKTGCGKSTLLLRLIVEDMRSGNGVSLIDPHGDLAERVVSLVPKWRTGDVIYFDAGDSEHPFAFNPLWLRSASERAAAASAIVMAFKKMHGDSWGPSLEDLLRNAALALLEARGASFASLMRMLHDKAYRHRIVDRVRDPVVLDFWAREFAAWSDRKRAEALPPVQNKLRGLLSYPELRNILAQHRNALNLRALMDERRILIVNLSKGRLPGEDCTAMLGSLLLGNFQAAAMSRANISEQDRVPHFLYVDEFQNFATDAFATMLSEVRKYGLSLTIANQYLDQMQEGTREAVFGNVDNLISFQSSADDAEFLARQFADKVPPQGLVALPAFHAYMKHHIAPHQPFSMATLPPPPVHPASQRFERIRQQSRRHCTQPRAVVEREIAKVYA